MKYAGRARSPARVPKQAKGETSMETGEWIAIAVGFVTILIAIFGMGLVLIQKIDNGDNRLDAKIDGVRLEFDAKLDKSSAAIIAELRSFRESVEGRLNGVEREQARQEGVLSVLVQRDRDARADRDASDG